MLPVVSVIIPAYNQAAYVEQAINSVLEQTFSNFELVLIDDGSTDETAQVIAHIQDPRFRVIRQPNAGLSAARNTGLRDSSAPLVTFLDADDYFLPDKLAVQVAFLDQHPEVGMVSGGTQIVDHDGRLFNENVISPPSLELSDLLMGNLFTVTSVLLRRFWLDCVGVFNETLHACEDWDLWLRMASAGCRFAWIEHPVVAYRYHTGQMTRESGRMRKAMLAVLDKFFSQPDLPHDLRACKSRAYASILIKSAVRAFHSGEFENGQHDLVEALRLDPTLAAKRYNRLVELLTAWSVNPQSPDPEGYLRRIDTYLPPGQQGLSREIHRAMAAALLGPLFKSSPETRRAHRKELFRAIQYEPAWLLNRGVLRMLVDAWLPLPGRIAHS